MRSFFPRFFGMPFVFYDDFNMQCTFRLTVCRFQHVQRYAIFFSILFFSLWHSKCQLNANFNYWFNQCHGVWTVHASLSYFLSLFHIFFFFFKYFHMLMIILMLKWTTRLVMNWKIKIHWKRNSVIKTFHNTTEIFIACGQLQVCEIYTVKIKSKARGYSSKNKPNYENVRICFSCSDSIFIQKKFKTLAICADRKIRKSFFSFVTFRLIKSRILWLERTW